MTPNFTREELACRCGCGLARFHPGALDQLQLLRTAFGRPMSVSSACRCAKHNATVSKLAPLKSLHIGDLEVRPGQQGALAFDVVVDGEAKGALFALAWRQGWSIGWNKAFLHLDRRVDLGMPQTTFEY